jgi:hypothetical protein
MRELRHLPDRFPEGTRFVIEGRRGQILARYLELPDGRHVDLSVVRADGRQRTQTRRGARKGGMRGAAK